MKIPLSCPRAEYGPGMMILCKKDGEPCGHQFFKSCKGWWALTPGAESCPVRKERDDDQGKAATANGCHTV